LRHYATRRKVVGSSPDEVNVFFSISLSFQSHYDLEVDSASNRNEYLEMFLWSTGQLAHKADNLTTICELTV
jgi:hypothetical protein